MERKKIFLLGGHDLEMDTIRAVLEKRKIPYADAGLKWSDARLSHYADELERYGDSSLWTIYGIELAEDVTAPGNYVRIDHHNMNRPVPSSLEQVAEILDEPMSRYMCLVAANDAAYIPGLQAEGATAGEIESVRRADRQAQGVSYADERLAEKVIAENLQKEGTMLIIYAAKILHFSPICDRLYPYDRLLIYTDSEAVYYGAGIPLLAEYYRPFVRAGRMYYGGGENGYFGIAAGAFTKNEIKELVGQIKDITSS